MNHMPKRKRIEHRENHDLVNDGIKIHTQRRCLVETPRNPAINAVGQHGRNENSGRREASVVCKETDYDRQ